MGVSSGGYGGLSYMVCGGRTLPLGPSPGTPIATSDAGEQTGTFVLPENDPILCTVSESRAMLRIPDLQGENEQFLISTKSRRLRLGRSALIYPVLLPNMYENVSGLMGTAEIYRKAPKVAPFNEVLPNP